MKRIVAFIMVMLAVLSVASFALAATTSEVNEWGNFRTETWTYYDTTSTYVIQDILHCTGRSILIDGIYGQGTIDTVRDYQGARALTVDGSVGPQTWKALCKEIECYETQTYPSSQVKKYRTTSSQPYSLSGAIERSQGSGFTIWTYKRSGSTTWNQFGV